MATMDTVLKASIEELAKGRVQSANLEFPLPGYGEPFFTKYLYFVGMVTHPARSDPTNPPPLIYDSVIRSRLWYMRTMLKEQSLAEWSSDDAGEYVDYCRTVATWATDLDVTVDQLETYLFKLNLDDPVQRLLEVAAAAEHLLQTDDKSSLEQASAPCRPT